VKAARAAGMPVIAVVDPHMRGQDFGGALAALDSLEQLTPAQLGF
jgi:beta-phosphoglucomutase-like phosphatase (HAD superfamily)